MEQRRGRPMGIWIVSLLPLVNAAVTGAEFLGIPANWPRWLAIDTAALDQQRWVYLLFALIYVAAAVLLWRIDRRGWALSMVVVGVGLVANLVLWRIGEPNHLRMALNVALAFYLNSRAVRELFERRHDVQRVLLSERSPEP